MDPKKGGVSQAIDTIAEQLAKMNILNEVVSLDSHDHVVANDHYRTTGLGPSTSKWSYSKRLLPWLLNNFCRFDTIIVHGLWLYSSFAVEKALREYKKLLAKQKNDQIIPKLYIMPHGMLDPYFQIAKDRKLKAIRNWVYWKTVESRVIKNADGLLFTCQEELLLAKQAFTPYVPKKELVVGLGVNEPPIYKTSMTDLFYEKCSGIKGSRYFLFLSRIDQKKGIDTFLHAYEQLIELNKDAVAEKIGGAENYALDKCENSHDQIPKLVIAGPGGDTPYGKKIKAIVESSQVLKANVLFSGMLQGDAKWGAFYGAELFVLPSHQENFGIAVVEALACGKAVLISTQINISHEINEEGAGIVSADTVQGTLSSLTKWHLTSASEKTRMEIQARKCFQKHYAVPAAVNRLVRAIV